MYNLELWIDKGTFCPRPLKPDGGMISDRKLLHDHNLVKLETGPNGTRISWVMFGANWASLYFLHAFVATCAAPVTLCYFNAGWFEETISSSVDAASRIEALVLKSDVRFSERVYIANGRPAPGEMPDSLRSIIEAGQVPDGESIVCTVDSDRGTTKVEHIGEESLLGKVWGRVPISYPALTGHSYDRIVSQSYFDVVRTGRMHYDQVLASMIMPNGEQQWFGYHRVIVPDTSLRRVPSRVRVACARAPVEIRLL
jgi:hypothetical protein